MNTESNKPVPMNWGGARANSGRPRQADKDRKVTIGVRLTPKHIKRLSRWMKTQGIKSRSAAVRDLIDSHCELPQAEGGKK